ncbi:hypothetical protein FCH28_14625 [Streptomyces piniterrae]|uniref:Uncharacterized protein n=1 Tax=Streptomyces piniterrae TaxID=2571125 RepID=A0A4U0NKR7_9ACTN|nr:hypothetical protein [Streptomyces piniterrae]TJZ54372.1 hypothetical protein FCH28_14625 [Streptomyces piniterrae]
MNVSNNIESAALVYGNVTQGAIVGNAHVPRADKTKMAANLAEKLDEQGPLLALTTAGQAEVAIRLLALTAEEHPELTDVADRLAEDLQAGLDAHRRSVR